MIVPCGRAKVWDRHPDAGPTAAVHAYTGAPFTVNRQYAEQSGGDWMILSAKYGFLLLQMLFQARTRRPSSGRATDPISFGALREQVRSARAESVHRCRSASVARNTGLRSKPL